MYDDGQVKPNQANRTHSKYTDDSSFGIKLERRAMIQSVQNKQDDFTLPDATLLVRQETWLEVLRNQSDAKKCAGGDAVMIDVKIYLITYFADATVRVASIMEVFWDSTICWSLKFARTFRN